MQVAIDKTKAVEYLNNYYTLVSTTGYAKHGIISRYLAWLFLLDFVESVYFLLSGEDYKQINNALISSYLFGSGCCLMPYKSDKPEVTFGEPIYIGTYRVRQLESGEWRYTEDTRIRTV